MAERTTLCPPPPDETPTAASLGHLTQGALGHVTGAAGAAATSGLAHGQPCAHQPMPGAASSAALPAARLHPSDARRSLHLACWIRPHWKAPGRSAFTRARRDQEQQAPLWRGSWRRSWLMSTSVHHCSPLQHCPPLRSPPHRTPSRATSRRSACASSSSSSSDRLSCQHPKSMSGMHGRAPGCGHVLPGQQAAL